MAQALADRFGPDNIQKLRAEAAGASEFSDFRKMLRDLQEQMKTVQNKVDQLQEENMELKKDKTVLESKVDQLESKVNQLQEENMGLKSKVDQLESKVDQLESKVAKLQEKFYHGSLRNFLQYYLRAAVVGVQIKDQDLVKKCTAGQLMVEITNQKERYDKWATSGSLPSYNQVKTLANPIIEQGNQAVHNSETDEMYKLIVDSFGHKPDLLVVYQKMWDGISDQRNWPKWAEMVAKHGKE